MWKVWGASLGVEVKIQDLGLSLVFQSLFWIVKLLSLMIFFEFVVHLYVLLILWIFLYVVNLSVWGSKWLFYYQVSVLILQHDYLNGFWARCLDKFLCLVDSVPISGKIWVFSCGQFNIWVVQSWEFGFEGIIYYIVWINSFVFSLFSLTLLSYVYIFCNLLVF